MAKLYSKSSALAKGKVPEDDSPEKLLSAIEAFLGGCHRPAALEWGENAIPLLAGQFGLQVQSGRLSIEIWSDNRSLARRILSIDRRATGLLDCSVQRFGGKPGRMTFLDLARPQTAHRSLTGSRQHFAEQFRNMVTRQFPGWQLDSLTVSQDLRRSFSGVYPRASLSRGQHIVAAVACDDPSHEGRLLTSALLWHRHLETTAASGECVTLALFLPDGCGNMTAQRLRWLDPKRIQAAIYLFNQHGSAGQVDPHDLGNLDTRVASQYANSRPVGAVTDGTPERWLESVVRANVSRIDAELRVEPVHSQVLTFAACDRDLIDLLAVSVSGRLCVLELKAVEDLHLPIQALDYWMRVAWHAQRGELVHLFPGIPLQAKPPKLILLAPAMAFHSSCADVLGYFSREIEVERVGVNSDWRNQLRVTLRLAGAAIPASHGAGGWS